MCSFLCHGKSHFFGIFVLNWILHETILTPIGTILTPIGTSPDGAGAGCQLGDKGKLARPDLPLLDDPLPLVWSYPMAFGRPATVPN